MIARDEAIELVKKHITSVNMQRHCLASEAVMRALARRLCENEEVWGMTGLLHDLDAELTSNDPASHGLVSAKLLEGKVTDEMIDAIVMHNEVASGKTRSTKFQHALAAGETITGLITATALVYPDKKITSVKPKSIVKRMKEKAFAASVSRSHILECEQFGIGLNEFAELALHAMQQMEQEPTLEN